MNILKAIENNKTLNFKNLVFSTTNAKLSKNNIASFNLPQGSTCPFAGGCLKFCYAAKGNYRFTHVKKKYIKNYELSLHDNFINIVNDSIKALPNVLFYRIHSSGDFYSKKYVLKWVEIATQNPKKVFYAYTKSIQLFKNIVLPDNFIVIQSLGTKNDKKYIDYSKPYAKIFDTLSELETAVESGKFIDSHINDLNAIKAAIKNKNVALLKH